MSEKKETEDFLELDLNDLAELCRDKEFRHGLNGRFIAYSLRNQIRQMRLERGWTQQELANRLETTASAVSRLENIKSPVFPSINTLRKIADIFDVALCVRFETWSSLFQKIAEVSKYGVETPRPFNQDPIFANTSLTPVR